MSNIKKILNIFYEIICAILDIVCVSVPFITHLLSNLTYYFRTYTENTSLAEYTRPGCRHRLPCKWLFIKGAFFSVFIIFSLNIVHGSASQNVAPCSKTCKEICILIQRDEIEEAEKKLKNKEKKICAFYLSKYYMEKGEKDEAENLLETAYAHRSAEDYELVDLLYYIFIHNLQILKNPKEEIKVIQRMSSKKASELIEHLDQEFEIKIDRYKQNPWTESCPEMPQFHREKTNIDFSKIEAICQTMKQFENLRQRPLSQDDIINIMSTLDELKSMGVNVSGKLSSYKALSEYYQSIDEASRPKSIGEKQNAIEIADQLKTTVEKSLKLPKDISTKLECLKDQYKVEKDISAYLNADDRNPENVQDLLKKIEKFSKPDCRHIGCSLDTYDKPLRILKSYEDTKSDGNLLLSENFDDIHLITSEFWRKKECPYDLMNLLKTAIKSQVIEKVECAMKAIHQYLGSKSADCGYDFTSLDDCSKLINILEENYKDFCDTSDLKTDINKIKQVEKLKKIDEDEAIRIADDLDDEIKFTRFPDLFGKNRKCRDLVDKAETRITPDFKMDQLENTYWKMKNNEKDCEEIPELQALLVEAKKLYFKEVIDIAYKDFRKEKWDDANRILEESVIKNEMFGGQDPEYKYAEKKRMLIKTIKNFLSSNRSDEGMDAHYDNSKMDYQFFKEERQIITDAFKKNLNDKIIKMEIQLETAIFAGQYIDVWKDLNQILDRMNSIKDEKIKQTIRELIEKAKDLKDLLINRLLNYLVGLIERDHEKAKEEIYTYLKEKDIKKNEKKDVNRMHKLYRFSLILCRLDRYKSETGLEQFDILSKTLDPEDQKALSGKISWAKRQIKQVIHPDIYKPGRNDKIQKAATPSQMVEDFRIMLRKIIEDSEHALPGGQYFREKFEWFDNGDCKRDDLSENEKNRCIGRLSGCIRSKIDAAGNLSREKKKTLQFQIYYPHFAELRKVQKDYDNYLHNLCLAFSYANEERIKKVIRSQVDRLPKDEKEFSLKGTAEHVLSCLKRNQLF